MNLPKLPKIGRPAIKAPKVKAPSVKAPNVKLPGFADDLVRDLRERGLLPVAGALLAAIVVVPAALAMTGGSDTPPPVAESVEMPAEGQVAVVAASSEVRDFRRRLKGIAKDPFVQKFAGPELSETLTPDDIAGGEDTGAGADVPSPGAGAPSPGGGGGGGGQVTQNFFYTHLIDMRAGPVGNLQHYRNVARFSALPSWRVPLVVFLGVNDRADKALFMVSTSAEPLAGDDPLAGNAPCMLPGLGGCELLSMEVGQTKGLTYTLDEQIYQLELTRIRRVRLK